MISALMISLMFPIGVEGLTVVSEFVMPETVAGFWLERPHSLAVDANGRVFVSDQDARVVFIWNAQGKPLGVWGGPGNGPGEFRGPAFLDVVDDRLHVLDPPAQRVELFNAKGEHLQTITLRGIFTSPMGFLVRPEGGYALVVHAVLEEQPSMKTVFLKPDGSLDQVIHSFPDNSFKLKESDSFAMQLVAYSGETTLSRWGDGYVIGCGYQPEIFTFKNGKADLRRIELKNLPARLVSDHDREEFMQMEIPWMDGSFKALKDLKRNIDVSFPKTMPYFTGIAAVGREHVLAYEFSKFSRVLKGRLFNREGQLLTPGGKFAFRLELGWQGTFRLVDKHLYALRYSEEAERFSLTKYQLQVKGRL